MHAMEERSALKLTAGKAAPRLRVLLSPHVERSDRSHEACFLDLVSSGCDTANPMRVADSIGEPRLELRQLDHASASFSRTANVQWGRDPRNVSVNKESDTPSTIRGFDNKNRLDSTMALRKLAQGGRPSKGPRHTFNVKPDIGRAEKLRDILEILDCNAVDYLTPLVAAHIDSIDLEKFRAEHTQETLPIAKAS